MESHYISLIGGSIAMIIGADYAVRASLALANRWGWPKWVAGMLLLALGTSLPEFFVSMASVSEHPKIALGNLLGSNVFNVCMVLGACMLFKGRQSFKVEQSGWPSILPLAIGSVLVFAWFFISPSAYYSSLVLVLLYSWIVINSIAKGSESEELLQSSPPTGRNRVYLQCLAGFVLLAGGADYFLQGAVGVSAKFGLQDGFVGFLLGAVGTSLPELFTSIAAVRQRHTEAVFGNIIGSNAFNLLITGGLVGIFVSDPLVDQLSQFMLYTNGAVTLLLIAPLLMFKLKIPNPRPLHGVIGVMMLVAYVFVIEHSYSL
ncbi:MAG: sodium:calcium antiporter [Planctomycetota bacterium]|jgi:cation:H+ antiporter|nr:sodium:calcium antiporter [Planctomycetota bacterium]